MQVHVEKVEPIAGVLVSVSSKCVENAILGGDEALIGKVRVLIVQLPSPKFYTYINQISNIYSFSRILSKRQLYPCFLILIHKRYINDFKVITEIRLKRNLEVGTLVRGNDIADILELRIPDIDRYKILTVLFVV